MECKRLSNFKSFRKVVFYVDEDDNLLIQITDNLHDRSYADCLRFREKLYSQQSEWFEYVQTLFEKFVIYLRGLPNPDVGKICEERRVKKLSQNHTTRKYFENFNLNDGNCAWILAKYFNGYIPLNASETLDPGEFLILIRNCRLFDNSVRLYADLIYSLRNKLHGHIPSLRCNADVVEKVKVFDLKLEPLAATFQNIIGSFEAFSTILAEKSPENLSLKPA